MAVLVSTLAKPLMVVLMVLLSKLDEDYWPLQIIFKPGGTGPGAGC